MLSACATLEPRPVLPIEVALPLGQSTRLDELLDAYEASNPGASAFRLVKDGPEAFVTRWQSARMAGRSLDVQTYIWHGDTTGLYLAREILAAADRGVSVRLLIDDLDARAKNLGFAALDAHRNVSVRLFNPFVSRSGKVSMVAEGLRSFGRINHRMHNKSWIADNRIALVGGRNLGDEYFGASDAVNFVDLDFAMVGPVVREASNSFDRYWNSPATYPMEVLDPDHVNATALEKLRAWLDVNIDERRVASYSEVLRTDDAVKHLIAGHWPMQWSTDYRFVADDPLKALLDSHAPERSEVLSLIAPLILAARVELDVISPYFVPGKVGTQSLVNAARGGVRVNILTNSLVANDVAAVHGGYSRYRPQLLEGGVHLWEMKPLPDAEERSGVFGSSGASLHTKALIVDHKSVFVGSYNLDPRSTWLNCEQGVWVANEVIARELAAVFSRQIEPQHAWRVSLHDQQLEWSDDRETFDHEPNASWSRRLTAWFVRVLHLDAQL